MNIYLKDTVQNSEVNPRVLSANHEEQVTQTNDFISNANSVKISICTDDNSPFLKKLNKSKDESINDIGNKGTIINILNSKRAQEKKASLKSDLQSWVIESGISLIYVNKLLRILISHGHKELPTDCRSLLQAPRENYVIQMYLSFLILSS